MPNFHLEYECFATKGDWNVDKIKALNKRMISCLEPLSGSTWFVTKLVKPIHELEVSIWSKFVCFGDFFYEDKRVPHERHSTDDFNGTLSLIFHERCAFVLSPVPLGKFYSTVQVSARKFPQKPKSFFSMILVLPGFRDSVSRQKPPSRHPTIPNIAGWYPPYPTQ